MTRRRGFTLIELLIVITVVGLLAGMLFPALASAVEQARQTGCVSHLRQIGLAMASYRHSHDVLPPAYVVDPQAGAAIDSLEINGVRFPDANRNAAGGFAWGMLLLPHLEQMQVYEMFNVDHPCWSEENRTAARQTVEMFLCPSSGGPSSGFHVAKGDYSGGDPVEDPAGFPSRPWFGHSHYVVNCGRIEPWGGERVDPYAADLTIPIPVTQPDGAATTASIDGPFYRNSRVRPEDVTDGLAYTVFVGEHTSSLSDKTWVGVVPWSACCPKPQFRFSDCNAAGALVGAHSGPDPGDLPDVIIHAPNNPFAHTCGMYSDHPRGGYVLMGDGHVRWVAEQIDPFTWAAMATMASGDQPGDF